MFFSIDKAKISKLFLLDKLVSGQVDNAENYFGIALLYRKKVEVTFENAIFRKIKKNPYKNNCSPVSHWNVEEKLLTDKLKNMGT